MKKILPLAIAALTTLVLTPRIDAHCQIPCGIYDDNNVIRQMVVDWMTIDKACTQIVALGKDPKADPQQLVRWVTNKESHAQDIQDKVLNYFLAQRLKVGMPTEEEYVKKLKLCHEVIVTAMACKQSTDPANPKKLHDLLGDFEKAFGSKE